MPQVQLSLQQIIKYSLCIETVSKTYHQVYCKIISRTNSIWTDTSFSRCNAVQWPHLQGMRHGVSLSAWYRPWILLGGLQARVQDLFSPATAFGLQYRRCTWFLPHAGLHLATAHSRSQELERGMRYRPVSPRHHLCPHSGDSWRHSFSSDNCVNNTNYCVVVLKRLAVSTTLILVNWTELKWPERQK